MEFPKCPRLACFFQTLPRTVLALPAIECQPWFSRFSELPFPFSTPLFFLCCRQDIPLLQQAAGPFASALPLQARTCSFPFQALQEAELLRKAVTPLRK